MAAWLGANIGSIVVILILAAIVVLAVRSMIKDKRSGKGGCGCGCANCALHGKCHSAGKQLNSKKQTPAGVYACTQSHRP